MGVPGLIVSRTDAEAASLLDSNSDERDHPFILGATNVDLPSYKAIVLAIHRRFFERGVQEIRGHLMFALSDAEYAAANSWLTDTGIMSLIDEKAAAHRPDSNVESMLDAATAQFIDRWQVHCGLKTYPEAVAEAIASRVHEGEVVGMTVEEWLGFAKNVSLSAAREKAASLGLKIIWDCELPKHTGGALPDQGRARLRDREVACIRAIRRSAVDGNQYGEPL